MTTTITKTEDVDFLLDDYLSWQSWDGQTFSISALKNRYSTTREALSARHPDLPQLIMHLLAYNKSVYDQNYVNGDEISLSLQHIEHGALDVIDVSGKKHKLVGIFKLIRDPLFDEAVTLWAIRINVEHFDLGGLSIPVTVSEGGFTGKIRKDELDRVCPDWALRWKIAEDLGLNEEEVIDHVFYSKPLPVSTIEMNEIGFDT